jgi:hypothetical protein
MTTFEPFINLLVVLTVLSVTAERVSNILKFKRPTLRDRQTKPEAERIREGQIQAQTAIIGIAIAVLTKADLFAFLTHLDDPWSTLGWVRVIGTQWFQSPATQSLGTILYSLGGCALTGLALGFGSKFWHDMLSTVFELRTIARNRGSGLNAIAGGGESSDAASSGDNDE